MKFFRSLFLTFVFIIPFLLMGQAKADLFISPLRVVFEGRNRSALVTLVNRSNKTNTYRIEWADKKMLDNGTYEDIDPLGTTNGGVSELVRYSPRQISLGPGEKQQIRLALRKPGDLANGEYRSHLLFQKLPDIPATKPAEQEGISMKLFVNLSFAIPIFVRHNVETVTATIGEASFNPNDPESDGNPTLKVRINREGDISPFGKLEVYALKDGQDKGDRVGVLNNVSILKEVAGRDFYVDIDPKASLKGKRLYVIYKGVEEFKDRTWDEKILQIN